MSSKKLPWFTNIDRWEILIKIDVLKHGIWYSGEFGNDTQNQHDRDDI